MNPAGLVPAAQSQALRREIEQQTSDQCRGVIQSAEREAGDLVAQAHAAARRRMHDAVVELRREARHRRAQAMAQVETEQRMRAQRHAADMIRRAWPLLTAALAARWRDPEAHNLWTKSAAGHARARLRGQHWIVRHPADWGADDSRNLRAALALSDDVQVELVREEKLESGLMVEVDQATLDATPAGLLADASAIEALLLAEIDRSSAPAAPMPARGRAQ